MSDTEQKYLCTNLDCPGESYSKGLCGYCGSKMLPDNWKPTHQADAKPVDGELREQIRGALPPMESKLRSLITDSLIDIFAAHLQAAVDKAEERGSITGWDAAMDAVERGEHNEQS